MILYTNANLFNPADGTWKVQSFSVENGKVTALDPDNAGAYTVIDLQGRRVIPGLIDAHVHIESSLLTPREFGRLIIRHGVTAAICDPHEIANVAGAGGIDFMLADARESPADLLFMVPSCVPATPTEVGGAIMMADDLKQYVGNPQVLGLGEMMNVPGVLADDPEVCAKLALFKYIDGHAPGLAGDGLKQYAAHGITSDHECTTVGELRDRTALGMYVFLREGDAAKNVADLAPGVTADNIDYCAFCTDDRHADSLAAEGSIDHCIRTAVKAGMPLETAIRLATLTVTKARGLSDRGMIAPGYRADFCVLEDCDEFRVADVYKDGIKVNADAPSDAPQLSAPVPPFLVPKLTAADIAYPQGGMLKGIAATPGTLLTEAFATTGNEPGVNKLVCIDRYRGEQFSCCPVRGLHIERGAIAGSIMHDAHHLMVAGANDEDMLKAVETAVKVGGGMVVCIDGRVTVVSLPVGGLMSAQRYEVLVTEMAELTAALKETGADPHAFMMLSFLGLTVIPHLKLTPRGLFDGDAFADIGPFW